MKRVVTDRSREVGEWVCQRLGTLFNEVGSVAIGQERDGVLVGGIVYDNFRRGASICMHVAATDPRWISRELLRVAFAYPFEQLKVRKVIGTVDSDNAAARRFDERLGFRLEAVIADAAAHGDILIYSMTAAQCRFLGEHHGQQVLCA